MTYTTPNEGDATVHRTPARRIYIGPPADAPPVAPPAAATPTARPFTGGLGAVLALAVTWFAGFILALVVYGATIAVLGGIHISAQAASLEGWIMESLILGGLTGGLLLCGLLRAVQAGLYRQPGWRWYHLAPGVAIVWVLAAPAYALLNSVWPYQVAPRLVGNGALLGLAGLLAGGAAGAAAGWLVARTGPARWQRVNLIAAAVAGAGIAACWVWLLLGIATSTPM